MISPGFEFATGRGALMNPIQIPGIIWDNQGVSRGYDNIFERKRIEQ